jgi:hypothetical protein
MDKDQDTRNSIVVIEAGAGWPQWITEYQRRAPNASVIAQTASEAPSDFGARALHRLAEIQRGPGRLGVGILLCSEGVTEELRAARRRVAHAIVEALHGSGDLVLAAIEGTEVFQQELFVLAGDLCEDQSVPRVNVRVRFGASQSGTMPSVLPGTAELEAMSDPDDQERVSWTGSA